MESPIKENELKTDLENLPEEKVLQERTLIYSPVKNRESFIDKKIRMLNEAESFGRQSLDCLGIRPRLSRIG
jgi:hypothetical protein